MCLLIEPTLRLVLSGRGVYKNSGGFRCLDQLSEALTWLISKIHQFVEHIVFYGMGSLGAGYT